MNIIKEIFNKGTNTILSPGSSIIKPINIDWTYHSVGVLNIAKHLEPDYKLRDDNRPIMRLMLQYFSGSEGFINGMDRLYGVPGDLSKGLILMGGVGTGKTLLFEIFKLYTSKILGVNSFRRYNAVEVVENVSTSGMSYLELFNSNNGNPITCYIDDILATNETVKHYGTDISVLRELINFRYLVYKNYNKLTHLSSNKYPGEFKEAYGDRIYDRMKEMLNFIELPGESYRK